MDSFGNWSMIARATVSPPTPESKIPIGAPEFITGSATGVEFSRDSGRAVALGWDGDQRSPPSDLPPDRPVRAHDGRGGHPGGNARAGMRLRGVRPASARW